MLDLYSVNYNELKECYEFKTDFGLNYSISFLEHHYFKFSSEKIDFSVYEIALFKSGKEKTTDKKVETTVCYLLYNFFIKNPDAAVLFICDSSDQKQASRFKLFERWFNKYQTTLIKLDYHGNSEIFYSLIFRENHPSFTKIKYFFNKMKVVT